MNDPEAKISRVETNKINRLEEAVMSRSPDEVRELIRAQGISIFPAAALALACRYRGLDMVKALVEGGAFLGYSYEVITQRGQESTVDFHIPYKGNLCAALLDKVVLRDIERLERHSAKAGRRLPPLPRAERLRILGYLIENAERVWLKGDDLLFIAYMQNEREFVSLLKEAGYTLRSVMELLTEERSDNKFYDDFISSADLSLLAERLSDDDLIFAVTDIVSDISEVCRERMPIRFDMGIWDGGFKMRSRFEDPALFRLLTEEFAVSEKDRKRYLKRVIFNQNIPCAKLAAKAGWLDDPKRRDAMIAFAQKYGKNESIAWLLDFKQRNFDLEAERAAAEQRIEDELNAPLDSPLIMGKLWKWEKLHDGSVRVIRYLGDALTVTVPPRIDGADVTEVGGFVFSPLGRHCSHDRTYVLECLTKICLPDTISEIGAGAFYGCRSMKKINIPPSVRFLPYEVFSATGFTRFEIGGHIKTICKEAFSFCDSLKKVVINEGVEMIQGRAFAFCSELETIELPRSIIRIENDAFEESENFIAKLHKGSYAEEYCRRADIPFSYFDD